MENNRAGQLRGLENFLLDNRPTSLDTILRLRLPGGPNSPLDENQFGQLNGVENAHPKSSNVANNQALLLLPDFGGPSNNINVNGFGDPDHLLYYRFCGVPYPEFGHGIGGLPPVGLDHPWFSSQATSVDHLLDYRQQVDNNVPFIHNTSRRNEWSSSRRRRRNISVSNRVCTRCGTTKTPMWRRGPDGPQTNCNACGLWYSRLSKKPPGEKGNKLGVY